MKSKMILDWDKIWRGYDDWWERHWEGMMDSTSWKERVQQLVEKELNEN